MSDSIDLSAKTPITSGLTGAHLVVGASSSGAGEPDLYTISALALAILASPVLTGTPTAPTAAGGTSTTQVATTAFVQAAIAGLLDAAPGALDTLNELAAALGDDANFAATMTTALAGKQATNANLTALAGLASAADKLPYFTGSGTAGLADFSAFGRSLIDDADATAARATLGLGTMATAAAADYLTTAAAAAAYQPLDSDLTTLAASITAFGHSLVDDANAAAARTTLGLVIGTDVQAYNARLADLAGISWAQGDIAYFNGTSLVRLAAGTSGHFLKTQGASANPIWDAAGGGTPGGSSGQLQHNNAGAFGGVNLWVSDANTLEQYNGTTAQALRVYNTRTDASNYERAFMRWASNVLEIGTEAAGTGTRRNTKLDAGVITLTPSGGSLAEHVKLDVIWGALYLQSHTGIGGVNFHAGTSLIRGSTNTLTLSVVQNYGSPGLISLVLPAAGGNNIAGGHIVLTAQDGSSTTANNQPGGHVKFDGGRGYGTGVDGSVIIGETRARNLAFGGVTSSFPAIKRSGTDLQVRLADDSDYGGLQLGATPAALKVGTYSAVGAETVSGYITIKDSGGTDRKVAVLS